MAERFEADMRSDFLCSPNRYLCAERIISPVDPEKTIVRFAPLFYRREMVSRKRKVKSFKSLRAAAFFSPTMNRPGRPARSILSDARGPIDRKHRCPSRPLRFALQCVNRQKRGQRGTSRSRSSSRGGRARERARARGSRKERKEERREEEEGDPLVPRALPRPRVRR